MPAKIPMGFNRAANAAHLLNPFGDTYCEFFLEKPFGRMICWWVALVILLAAGSGVFHALEWDNTEDLIKERKYLISEVTEELFELGISRQNITYFKEKFAKIDSLPDNNPWHFAGGCFFCLSTALTIGYGNFTPVTEGGQLFAIFYSLIGILVFLAFMLDFLNSNDLMVKLLGKRIEKAYDLDPDAAYIRAKRIRQIASWTLTIFMLLFCLLMITHEEDWTFLEGIYFAWVTLTTIGYGDYVPEGSTDSGIEWYGIFMLFVVPP
eukprot:UN27858